MFYFRLLFSYLNQKHLTRGRQLVNHRARLHSCKLAMAKEQATWLILYGFFLLPTLQWSSNCFLVHFEGLKIIFCSRKISSDPGGTGCQKSGTPDGTCQVIWPNCAKCCGDSAPPGGTMQHTWCSEIYTKWPRVGDPLRLLCKFCA